LPIWIWRGHLPPFSSISIYLHHILTSRIGIIHKIQIIIGIILYYIYFYLKNPLNQKWFEVWIWTKDAKIFIGQPIKNLIPNFYLTLNDARLVTWSGLTGCENGVQVITRTRTHTRGNH
jgi:hypothetical protein